MKKGIVLVNQSSGYLMIDIVNAFANSNKYKEIIFLTGKANTSGMPLDKRVKTKYISFYNRGSILTRTISWIKGAFQTLLIIKRNYKEYDLFLTSNPPIISFITLFCKNNYSTLIYDVYPDGLVTGGFITKKNILFKVWRKVNLSFYRNAERVFSISEGMKEYISAYCPQEKIEIVPLWHASTLGEHIVPHKNIFIKNNNLYDKFIILYSGNIGKGHDLEVLLKVAKHLQSDKDILFIFIGEGYSKKHMIDYVADNNLNDNCLFFPFQDLEMLPHSLSSADISVITVAKEASKVCVPSKTFNLLKIGKPLLCIAEPHSEINRLVNKYNVGKCFNRDDISGIASFITDIKTNRARLVEFQSNALKCSQLFTAENAKQFVYNENKSL